ncbi:hypothetical protein fugu_019928 [Takifugu bimaculatus]|uniref:Rab-GAP TBC domain-containing protein n=1 Tax=Takifugu bimaculatus TaxID=433685 RepID=A0A4Z2BII6_9TELE|nr:hypothetical protein fugu_019928 [Takifugu bimaculatus]
MNYLGQKAPEELRAIIQEAKYRSGLQSAKLIRQLRRRDRLSHKLQKNYDIITACLQAVSQKRRVDTRLRFSIEPSLGKNGFQQWYDALKAVARLPTGIPKEWRRRVWLTLADQYLHSISIDWEKTLRFAFNERSNPDDDSLGIQIVKDLHRTGCSSYCGQEGEQDRVVLKRVLLAYARWNKAVGYCQGFNVLPESYFANNLRALSGKGARSSVRGVTMILHVLTAPPLLPSVDMAVFRDLLRLKLPRLSQHLHLLQKSANKEAGGSYEPPLTNVFTMQWFLTIFATCLPAPTVLKIWDSVFFEGSEMLFRVALAIWERLGERIEYCKTADEFYSTMGCLTQEMLEENLFDSAELMQEVYSMAVFPFPQLAELREKYTGGLGSWESDDDADMDDEDSMVTALGCLGPLGGLLAPELQRYQKYLKEQRAEESNIAELSPGAVGAAGAGGGGAKAEHKASINSMMMERMNTDIYALKKQYARIKRRQQQQAMQLYVRTDKCPATRVLPSQLNPSSTVINHLLLGRKPRGVGSGYPNIDTSGLQGRSVSQGQASPVRHHRSSLTSIGTGSPGSSKGGRGSPWHANVRVHRRNVARARAQLGFGDSEERKDDEDEVKRGSEEEQKDGSDSSFPQSPNPSGTGSITEETRQAKVGEVVGQLEALDLEDINPETEPPVPLLPPPPPSSRRLKESDSSGSEQTSSPKRHFPAIPLTPPNQSVSLNPSPPPTPSHTPSPVPTPSDLPPSPSMPCSSSNSLSALHPSSFYRTPSPSTPSLSSLSSSSRVSLSPSTPAFPSSGAVPPKPQVFSPFPCVKQPRKSVAARNLGLYGPTSRTPTVHFPQLSRNLNRSSGAGTTGRR